MRKCFKRGNIPSSVFNTLLEQFNEHNFIPRVVVFYHGGEPLRNKELPAMISVFKNLGVKKTVITTNTSLLNKEVALQLQDAGLDELKVSYDGCSPEENNEIRKNANFEINSKNLISFLENNNHTNEKEEHYEFVSFTLFRNAGPSGTLHKGCRTAFNYTAQSQPRNLFSGKRARSQII